MFKGAGINFSGDRGAGYARVSAIDNCQFLIVDPITRPLQAVGHSSAVRAGMQHSNDGNGVIAKTGAVLVI
jgi:hypothetical protein